MRKIKINCPKCGGWHVRKNGFYTRQRNRRKVQRYQCYACDHTFSDQTYDKTYRQKRPDLLKSVLKTKSNGSGIRKMAENLETSVTTIQRKIKFLDKVCYSFQIKHLPEWERESKPRFQFDEFWSIENARWQALTVPIVVEKESHFIVYARAAYDLCKSGDLGTRQFFNQRRASGINEQDKIIKRVIKKCLIMKPEGRIVIESDSDATYKDILDEVVSDRLVHNKYKSKIEGNKLFPVNNVTACIRAENAMLRRESWYVTKDKDWLNRHLNIYTFYHNFMRKKKYTTYEDIVNRKTGKILGKIKHEEKVTPAQHLKIFDMPLNIEYLLKHC